MVVDGFQAALCPKHRLLTWLVGLSRVKQPLPGVEGDFLDEILRVGIWNENRLLSFGYSLAAANHLAPMKYKLFHGLWMIRCLVPSTKPLLVWWALAACSTLKYSKVLNLFLCFDQLIMAYLLLHKRQPLIPSIVPPTGAFRKFRRKKLWFFWGKWQLALTPESATRCSCWKKHHLISISALELLSFQEKVPLSALELLSFQEKVPHYAVFVLLVHHSLQLVLVWVLFAALWYCHQSLSCVDSLWRMIFLEIAIFS